MSLKTKETGRSKYIFLGQQCFKEKYEEVKSAHNRIQSARYPPPSQVKKFSKNQGIKNTRTNLPKNNATNQSVQENILDDSIVQPQAKRCIIHKSNRSQHNDQSFQSVAANVKNQISKTRRPLSQNKQLENLSEIIDSISPKQLPLNENIEAKLPKALEEDKVQIPIAHNPERRFKAPLPPRRKQSPICFNRPLFSHKNSQVFTNISSCTNVNTSMNGGASTPHSAQQENSSVCAKENQRSLIKRLNSQQNLLVSPPPAVTSRCWAIFDQEKGEFLHGKRDSVKREVASLTKIMTLYTVLKLLEEYQLDPKSEIVKVSDIASKVNGTSACLKWGDELSVYDLFFGLMLPSGNDAAWALAEHFGSILQKRKYCKDSAIPTVRIHSQKFNWSVVRFFLHEMNKNASSLQLYQSNYDSPHGLMNKWNYSSAYDVAKLSTSCMKLAQFREVVGTREYQCVAKTKEGAGREYRWENTNRMLAQEGYNGVKTGITDAAGPCLAVSYESGENRLVVVILNCKSMEQRWAEIPMLVQWACAKRQMQREMKENVQANRKGLLKRMESLR